MKQSFDQRISERVKRLTGLEGESLDFVTGAAIATATIGKYPTKVDMYTYLGISEREMDHISHKATKEAWANYVLPTWFREAGLIVEPKTKAMVYTIATDLIANRFLESVGDGDGRARLYLSTTFQPQQIQSRAAFSGYLIVLEYLRHRERGLDSTLPQFLKLRYGGLKVYDNLSAFCEIVAENNPDTFAYVPSNNPEAIPQSDYGFVIGRLRAGMEDDSE